MTINWLRIDGNGLVWRRSRQTSPLPQNTSQKHLSSRVVILVAKVQNVEWQVENIIGRELNGMWILRPLILEIPPFGRNDIVRIWWGGFGAAKPLQIPFFYLIGRSSFRMERSGMRNLINLPVEIHRSGLVFLLTEIGRSDYCQKLSLVAARNHSSIPFNKLKKPEDILRLLNSESQYVQSFNRDFFVVIF